jgi:hypothetical protein
VSIEITVVPPPSTPVDALLLHAGSENPSLNGSDAPTAGSAHDTSATPIQRMHIVSPTLDTEDEDDTPPPRAAAPSESCQADIAAAEADAKEEEEEEKEEEEQEEQKDDEVEEIEAPPSPNSVYARALLKEIRRKQAQHALSRPSAMAWVERARQRRFSCE